MDEVHRVIRRVHADEAHGDCHVVRACIALDQVQCAQGHLLCEIEPRARLRFQTHCELAGVGLRENLHAEPATENPHGEHRCGEVAGDEQPATGHKWPREDGHKGLMGRKGLARSLRPLGPFRPSEQPHTQHRHERAAQKIRRHHRKAHRHRQRREERFRCARHEKRGRENREHAEHREQSRHRGLQRGVVGGAGCGGTAVQMRVDVFDRDRGFIHQDSHRERESAERHQMDALARHPQRERRRQQRHRDINDHDDRTPHAAQKQQHHEPRQSRADCAFFHQIANRTIHHRRLIHLQRYLHVLRHCGLKLRKVCLHQIHHRKRRGIGAFRHRHVHCAAAVHERVARHDVALIIHARHVADIDCAVRRHANRHGFEVLRVFHHGVHGNDRILVAEIHVPARAQHVCRGDGLHDFIRRHPQCAQPLRLCIHHDRPCAPAKRRRRRDSGQRGKKRAHHVQCRVLHLTHRPRRVLRRKNKLPDRHRARVEARYKRPRRARWHECARAIHIRHRLRHRRRHIRAGVELQLHDARALDALALHMLDARDVQKVILVVVSEVALHLRRVHAAVRLRDVDRRDAQRGEHIARHPLNRHPPAEAQRHHGDDHRKWSAERTADEVHEKRGRVLQHRADKV